jgi:F-type H+-transporting ATPase subunit gamma
MASLKTIRRRISSVKSTQQITKAMKMVAAAKLRRAQDAAMRARPYAEKIRALLRAVGARVAADSHPLLAARETERRIDLVVVTSDRGLCGGFNTNLLRRAEQFRRVEHSATDVRLTVVGRKGVDFYKRRAIGMRANHANIFGGPGHALAEQLGAEFARDFAAGETDGVYILYSMFRSALSQVPTIVRLLPVSTEASADATLADYLYEPDPATLLDRLLRQYITSVLDHAFLESLASFFGAQMTAMDSATTNASDMIGRLTLEMNRARQAAITKELMEIVGGAEALKG